MKGFNDDFTFIIKASVTLSLKSSTKNVFLDKTKFIMSGLIHAHSGLRWIVLILLVAAIFNAFSKKSAGEYKEGDRKLNLFAMIAFHTQFLIGWILYFTSNKVQFFDGWMKDSMYRFYGLEHPLMMTLAFILITVGHSKSKKAKTSREKFGVIATFYTIALILILAGIPWPFRAALGGSWF